MDFVPCCVCGAFFCLHITAGLQCQNRCGPFWAVSPDSRFRQILRAGLWDDFRRRRKIFAGTLLFIALFLGCTTTDPAARRTVGERLTAVQVMLALDRPAAAERLLAEIRSGPRDAAPPLIRLGKKLLNGLTSGNGELY